MADPTDMDREAYRVLIWARAPCPWAQRPGICPFGFPGCACADWYARFEELGWFVMPYPDADGDHPGGPTGP